MPSRPLAVLAFVSATLAPAQTPSWLKPVARLTVPTEFVIAADIAADGASFVTLTDRKLVRVLATSPRRELGSFTVPEKLAAADVRFAADGATVIVLGEAGSPTFAAKFDGTPLEPIPEVPPLAKLVGRLASAGGADKVRGTRDGALAVGEIAGEWWLSGSDTFERLSRTVVDVRMTGDGSQVLVRRDHGVLVLPAAGGEPWSVPDVGAGTLAVPFGSSDRFVAVDRDGLSLCEASARRVVQREPLSKLGIEDGTPTCIAARPDGKRFVLTTWSAKTRKGSGWLLDLDAMKATRVPGAPHRAVWVHDGFAMLGGLPGPCSTLHMATWTWLPSEGEAAKPWPAKLETMPMHDVAVVPGRQEFVQHDTLEKEHNTTLARFDASDGTILAVKPPPKSKGATDEFKSDSWSNPVVVGDHLLVAHYRDSFTLELRRLDDLRLLANSTFPDGFDGSPDMTAAEHAPRLAFWFLDRVAVFDFTPPAPK